MAGVSEEVAQGGQCQVEVTNQVGAQGEIWVAVGGGVHISTALTVTFL